MIGCGRGELAIALATAFPDDVVAGFDPDPPWGMRVVAPWAPNTAGMPNSRATISAWQSAPPSSTTSAPTTGINEFFDGPVSGATSTSPGSS